MRIALAAGGTAGHVYPALATLGALRAAGEPVEARFFGPDDRGERALVRGHDIPFEAVPAAPIRGRSPLALARGLARAATGIAAALRALRRFRPHVMLSTGGYGSFPPSVAARLLRLPLVVFLPDIEPGLAVRVEARFATRIATATETPLPHLPAGKTVVSGYPVRAAFGATHASAREALGWDADERAIVVTGATQGARAINTAVWQALPRLCEAARVVHVTGEAALAAAEAERAALPEDLRERYQPAAFREDLPAVMAAADLAVMRAGASVLGELPAAGLPALLVPGEFAGGHQRENARWLVDRGGRCHRRGGRIGDARWARARPSGRRRRTRGDGTGRTQGRTDGRRTAARRDPVRGGAAMSEIRGPVHIVGIGGMHMSAIAQLLHERGERVQGSDLEPSALTSRLEALGVTVFRAHAAENLGAARCVVATAAAREDNPDIVEARRRGLPVLGRPEVVASLMAGRRVIAVAGSHGKTTTTSLIAVILAKAGRAPMYLIGGESRDLGGNASWGGGDLCVVEADEYQRAFHAYEPDVAVITNVDADHLDLYGTPDAYEDAFVTFARRVRAGGRLFAGSDDRGAARVVAAVADAVAVQTYGLSESCRWRAVDLTLGEDGAAFTVTRDGEPLGELAITIPGRYAVRNTLAAAAVCLDEGVPFATVRGAAGRFRGAKRRFERIGEAGGVLVIDEYAHHPSEVRAVLEAARARFAGRRLIGIHQPHTYSRIAYLWESWLDCWEGLDALIVLETYAARETPLEGRSAQDLARAIAHPPAAYAPNFAAAIEQAAALAHPGDVVLTIGAGSVGAAGPLLLERLR